MSRIEFLKSLLLLPFSLLSGFPSRREAQGQVKWATHYDEFGTPVPKGERVWIETVCFLDSDQYYNFFAIQDPTAKLGVRVIMEEEKTLPHLPAGGNS